MQNKQATKLEQLKETSKQAKKAQKQEEQVKQPKDLNQAKELKHPLKLRRDKVSNVHRTSPYTKYLPKISTSQQSHISTIPLFCCLDSQ